MGSSQTVGPKHTKRDERASASQQSHHLEKAPLRQQHFTAPDILRAYHGNPAVKAACVKRFADHRAAGHVVQDVGFGSLHGGFIGCVLDVDQPEWLPIDVGWPAWFGELAEAIFGNLPLDEAVRFGSNILEAVPVGANLELIRIPFLLSIQQRNIARLSGNAAACAQPCREAVQAVINHLEHRDDQGSVVESAAWAAVESAWTAASARTTAKTSAKEEVVAALSTESAARAAALSMHAVALAAWASARADHWSTKAPMMSEEWDIQSKTLLSLLRAATPA